jgi:hypothetical protein
MKDVAEEPATASPISALENPGKVSPEMDAARSVNMDKTAPEIRVVVELSFDMRACEADPGPLAFGVKSTPLALSFRTGGFDADSGDISFSAGLLGPKKGGLMAKSDANSAI